jgi:hypothetical protein
MRLLLALVVLGMALTAVSIDGHHSFAAEFDANQPVSLRGTVVRLDWVNPHSWIHIAVKSADGKVEQWAVEGAGPTQLMRRGMRKTDFPVGIDVEVTGYRARNRANVAAARSIKKLDGTEYFFSGSAAP